MKRKLKCVIVDDDPEAHQSIIEHIKDSPMGVITHSFYKPSDFLGNIHRLDIDVVFLDIMFPNDTLQGFDIAPRIKAENKILIFISGQAEFIVEACKYAGAIDVVPKPNTKDRLLSALLKAQNMLAAPKLNQKERELFFIAGRKEKVSLLLSDFLFVNTSIQDPRNKTVTMKNGKSVTLMNYTFEQLLQLSSKLAQINRSQLISYDIVDSVLHDTIYLKADTPLAIPKILTLSRNHRKEFKINFI